MITEANVDNGRWSSQPVDILKITDFASKYNCQKVESRLGKKLKKPGVDKIVGLENIIKQCATLPH